MGLSCETCELAKHCRSSYTLSSNKSTSSFVVVHSDVWVSAPVTSLFGFCYFVTFVDDFSRATWVYLLKSKSEVFSVFQLFHKMVETQFDTKLKVLHLDSGGEYISNTFSSYLVSHGVIHCTNCPHTPEQNNIVERKNCHLLEVTCALLF